MLKMIMEKIQMQENNDLKEDDFILVTGGAGFIGSNLVRHLNQNGYENIVVVDDLTDARKFRNIKNAKFVAYLDKDDLFTSLGFDSIKQVFHLGAISSTTHKNGKELMKNNYEFSLKLFGVCEKHKIPVQYASSASVYGNKKGGETDPLNCYAFSKLRLDVHTKLSFPNVYPNNSNIVGLRFFNVYGRGEHHKEGQSSPVLSFFNQAVKYPHVINVFDEPATRDFVHVDDVCKFMIWLMNQKIELPATIDVGTGTPRSFEDVANLVIKVLAKDSFVAKIANVPMPPQLKGAYQYHTQAHPDMKQLGYPESLLTLEEGVLEYVTWLQQNQE